MSDKPVPGNGNGKPPQLTEQTLKQLIEAQTKEQALRSQELQIRAQELAYQSKNASEIIAAQERDREKERIHNRRMLRGPLICLTLVFVLILVFFCVALYMGKDAVVLDIVKIASGMVAGGAGGYGIGRAKKQQDSE